MLARFKCLSFTKCPPRPPFAGFAPLALSFHCELNTVLSEWNELSSCIQVCDSVAIPFSLASASQFSPYLLLTQRPYSDFAGKKNLLRTQSFDL